MSEELAGAMVWSLDLDDFSSRGCSDGRFPLISQLKNVFQSADDNISRIINNHNNDNFTNNDINNTRFITGHDSDRDENCNNIHDGYHHNTHTNYWKDNSSNYQTNDFDKNAIA
nr:hypothetical protein BaRGS_001862 [Batillaria attramentaria]KAG5710492.1 hypothetical protein BaRGS_022310 [Batillaria attramentaria]